MAATILPFPDADNGKAFNDFLETLRVAYRENRLRSLICKASINYRTGEKLPGYTSQLESYWFSLDGSCTEAIGLCELMKDEIIGYMKDQNAED